MTVVARENSSWLVGSKCRTVPKYVMDLLCHFILKKIG